MSIFLIMKNLFCAKCGINVSLRIKRNILLYRSESAPTKNYITDIKLNNNYIKLLHSIPPKISNEKFDIMLYKNIFYIREVSVALQSVFQASELAHYVTLPKQEKEEQLMELMCLVAGIRLFNRDCQRGGEGIDDRKNVE